MFKIKALAALLAFTVSTFAASRTSPPAGALVVGPGFYSTVQAAVNALKSTSQEQIIFINPGTYNEQVTINKLAGPLTIYGYTQNTASYASNTVTIAASHSLLDEATDDATGTLRVETTNFKLYNVNVVNSHGSGSQALAVSANAGNQGYYACSFKGFQDTLLAETGAQLYSRCYIEGATDFIFGQQATAWFEKCTIGVLPASIGYITASGRTSNSASYYVFNGATIGAAPGKSVTSGVYYLGRPWGDYARVAYQSCSMSNVINGAGWHIWNTGDERTDHVSFGEYSNSGAGASGIRASFATKLSSALTIGSILGSSYASQYYVDTSYL
ncbi:carbohydrate esterase family 8 protein [Trichoderma virens Gv29-8]|uniref:Pectinesterase n=1 Tax=Hypocrea virens (strain Gv29-8 / FGSC 10586) TaxID=413071 RepID=G9MMP9_HYPVG|nr:carbohydrate esterase family 8 protein [Trichoderma virens Gv29-8]EHK24617.1 carbohydrate esterase family 8 protein [Trichoderma virens Gv29-8]UKZ54885.1 hypothetical protein TrVGV298_008699 [Trichoderma virens]